MIMSKWYRLICIVLVLVLITACFSVLLSWRQSLITREIDKRRLADVNNLTKAYIKATFHYPMSNITFNVLESILREEGLWLYNPLAINSNVPCYKIVYNEKLEDEKGRIVIQESENVNSDNRVQSYDMGYVLIVNKPCYRGLGSDRFPANGSERNDGDGERTPSVQRGSGRGPGVCRGVVESGADSGGTIPSE